MLVGMQRLLGVGALSLAGIAAVVLLVFVPMCRNKLSGSAEVEGTRFAPSSCRSTAPQGGHGVEIEAEDGRRLQVEPTEGGAGAVYLFERGELRGAPLGACAGIEIAQQHSEINNVRNVEGTVQLHCSERGAATGRLEFANCH